MERAGKSQWIGFANGNIDCIGTATAWEERIILASTLGE
jgi:cytochrome P450